MTPEPVYAAHAVLTKHLFGSPWSPRRLLRRRPRVIAIFSFRYDADLVPDLIENLRPIVDGYVAYDDRGASKAYTDERARKAVLRKEAREMGAEWLLCIDPDERLEMATSERIKTMTNAIAPVIWTFGLREMYTPTAYRVDGGWKKKRLGCLFPVIDRQIFSDVPLHGQRAPLNPKYKKRDSGLNLYHLKMIDAERRKARRDFYKALDPESDYQKIGYDYLGDETGLELEEVPASRLYRPLYRETGGIWQPNLASLRPIAEGKLRETSLDPPGPEKGGEAKQAPAAPLQGRRLLAPFGRLARGAFSAAARAFPDTADRAALFVWSALADRPLKDRAQRARARALIDARTPQGARPSRGKVRHDKTRGQMSARIAQQIKSLFSNPPTDWSAADQIFLMRALRRLDLLTEWDFHVLLTRLFAQRRMELVRSLVEDDGLGFDLVRDFHRARLGTYFGDVSLTVTDAQDLHRRAKGSFLEEPALNEFLSRCIRQGDADAFTRVAIETDGTGPVNLSDDGGGRGVLSSCGEKPA